MADEREGRAGIEDWSNCSSFHLAKCVRRGGGDFLPFPPTTDRRSPLLLPKYAREERKIEVCLNETQYSPNFLPDNFCFYLLSTSVSFYRPRPDGSV